MNFFQVPNFLWDREDLDVYERVILTHIIRKTIGWGKSEDGISLGQFQKALGISKNTVIKALKKLIEKKIISKNSTYLDNGSQSFNSYSLTDEIIKLANSSVSDEQGVVHEMNTQNTSNTKDTNTKDTNTKEKTNKKEPLKEEKKSNTQKLMDLIRDFYEENNLSLTSNKVFQYERKLYELSNSYSVEDIEEVIKFAIENEFYKRQLTNPNSLFNNFEAMKLARREEEYKRYKKYKSSNCNFLPEGHSLGGELYLPDGWVL